MKTKIFILLFASFPILYNGALAGNNSDTLTPKASDLIINKDADAIRPNNVVGDKNAISGDSLNKSILDLDRKLKQYQYDYINYTTHLYPLLSIVISGLALLGVFITIINAKKERQQSEILAKEERQQSEILAKEEREQIERLATEERRLLIEKLEYEKQERQKEQSEAIKKYQEEIENKRIEAKLKSFSETFDGTMKFLMSDIGTVAESSYYALSLQGAVIIDNYPQNFQNMKSGVMRVLMDFFIFDADYYHKPHHTFMHYHLLNNISEFNEATKKMSGGEQTQLLQRYMLALKGVMKSEISNTFYRNEIKKIKTGDNSGLKKYQKEYPNEWLLAQNLTNNLKMLHDIIESIDFKNAIKVMTIEVYGDEDLYNCIIIKK